MIIRYPAVAGAFYPADPAEIKRELESYLKAVPKETISGELKALVVPHAGTIYSGPVAAFGYSLLGKSRGKEKLSIILIGPSHFVSFSGAATFLSDFWQTPLGKVKINPRVKLLIEKGESIIIDSQEAHSQEHSLEVQLPFLQLVLKDWSLLPIVCGEVNPVKLAEIFDSMIDENTFVVVSSDLSHYYPYELAKEIDQKANEAIPNLDFKKTEKEVEACGKIGILTLMAIAKKRNWKGKLLDYRNSGDTAGDKSQVVGYGCYAFYK